MHAVERNYISISVVVKNTNACTLCSILQATTGTTKEQLPIAATAVGANMLFECDLKVQFNRIVQNMPESRPHL